MLVLSCQKCIKHVEYPLTKQQAEKIVEIITEAKTETT